MSGTVLVQAMQGLHHMMIGHHQYGQPLSSSTKGDVREDFIKDFLSKALPSHYRFGGGDIVDSTGQKTGEVDIVIENPFTPSFPLTKNDRLYVAEGVAAVIEVKSDIKRDFKDVLKKASEIKLLNRKISVIISSGQVNLQKIPFYAVGYFGFRQLEELKQKMIQSKDIDGIFIVNLPMFFKKDSIWSYGVVSLFDFLFDLNEQITRVLYQHINYYKL